MKAEEFLSSALHTAKESIKQGQLLPSATVKQGESYFVDFSVGIELADKGQFIFFIIMKCPCTLYFICAVIRKLNELYKNCVTYCRSLNHRLQTFLLDKQKLMDRFNGLTAEKLIYSHTVHMVSSPHSSRMLIFTPNQILSRMHLYLGLNVCVLNAFRFSLLL